MPIGNDPHPVFVEIVAGWTLATLDELTDLIDEASAWANDYGLTAREDAVISLMIGRQLCLGISEGHFDYLRPHDCLSSLSIAEWRGRFIAALNATWPRHADKP